MPELHSSALRATSLRKGLIKTLKPREIFICGIVLNLIYDKNIFKKKHIYAHFEFPLWIGGIDQTPIFVEQNRFNILSKKYICILFVSSRGNNFSKRKFILTRLEKLMGLNIKCTKYLWKVFMVRLGKSTGFHWKFTKTYDEVLRFLKN